MQTCPRCKLEDALELDYEQADSATCVECEAQYAVAWDAESDGDGGYLSSWEPLDLLEAPRLSPRRRLRLWWERRKADARWLRWQLRRRLRRVQ